MSGKEILRENNVTVKYKEKVAVNDVSLSVYENEVFGIIGPNGAGKTSLVEAIEGLRKPASGEISVLGMNPLTDRLRLFNQVGVQLQQTTYPDHAKVRDICKLFSSFYEEPVPYSQLLDDMGIRELEKKYINTLSGGERQKLSIVLSLICKPKVVFWDELTTGLDPLARHELYEKIRHYKKQGLTIVLITHYMEEIEKLCDRVALMHSGKILSINSPKAIINEYNAENLDDVFLKIVNLNQKEGGDHS